MQRALPTVIEADIMSECWTYYKMAVIQTSPHYMEWLASHLDVVMRDNLRSNFGVFTEKYPMNYFYDILAIHETDICTLTPENIVSRIIYEIDKGRHVVIYLNKYALWNGKNDYFDLHESFIYGYDSDNQLFLVSELHSTGRFGKDSVPYERLKFAFSDTLKYYKENPYKLITKRQWFCPVASLYLRPDYREDNAMYYFLEKLLNEANGVKSETTGYGQDAEKAESKCFYSGLSCLIGIEEVLSSVLSSTSEPEEWVTRRLSETLFRFYEHRNLIKKSMLWAIEKLKLEDKGSKDALLQYGKCCEQMQMLYMLGYKVRQTNDVNGLHRIKDYMREQYISEKKALLAFEGTVRSRYTEIMLGKIQI